MSNAIIDLDIVYHHTQIAEDQPRFLEAAEWVAARFQLPRLSVSIAIVDDKTIHGLNREHLDHDWPTDVISFVFESEASGVEGEIVASAETAEKTCSAAGWKASDELLLYVVHGLLHLAGLDDRDTPQRQRMREAERDCLMALGVADASEHLDRWDRISI